MLGGFAKSLFGSSNDRYVKSLGAIVAKIASFEPTISAMTDAELSNQTVLFRERLANGTKLDDLLPEGLRHGARGGEADPGAAPLRRADGRRYRASPRRDRRDAHRRGQDAGRDASRCISTRLPGTGVHVITVNDYLAERDAGWMSQVSSFLGLTTGVIIPNLTDQQRRDAYRSDITYGTNNEFGFDYLRDNMKYERSSMVPASVRHGDRRRGRFESDRRGAHPLIISGPTDDKSDLYKSVDAVVKQLTRRGLREGREAEVDHPDRGWHREGRAHARGGRAARRR